METKKTTMRLDDETRHLIDHLITRLGGNQTTVMKQAIRVLARQEGIELQRERRMYTYALETSISARANLDEKSASDAWEDARGHYPGAVITGKELEAHANSLVDLALEQNDDLTDDPEEYRARYVQSYCKAYQENIAQKKEDEKRIFTYEAINGEDITSTDLQEERARCSEKTMALRIRILDSAEKEFAERAEALYDPEAGRIGISWGADATWADADGLEEGIEMWLNDGEEWNRRN